MHLPQRFSRLCDHKAFVVENLQSFEKVIADGQDIDPSRIDLCLQRIDAGSEESNMFRMATLTWSVPVSNGFGRQLRYLVWDNYHGRLAGVIALGDPVFNLRVRDNLIGWNSKNRCDRLSNVLDAYVLGALPPYNLLLVGKAIACLVRTQEIYQDFVAKYGSTRGLISKKKKHSRLLLVTTSSSLGRSSLYNRLKLHDRLYFRSVGFTEGWGHFHIPDDLFSSLRDYLAKSGHPYANGHRFGQGPNWRLRTIREGLKALGVSESMLHHGLRREVFVCEFARNSLTLLKSGRGEPELSDLRSVKIVASEAMRRWGTAKGPQAARVSGLEKR